MNAITNSSQSGQAILADLLARCRTRSMSVVELFGITDSLQKANLFAQAAEIYKNWIAFNSDHQHVHLVYFNYSVVLRTIDDIAGSINALRTSISIKPDFAQSHINLGRALEDAHLIPEALGQWNEYIKHTETITPDRLEFRIMALQHTGRVLENASRYQEAEDILWQAMELRPEKREAPQHWTAMRQRQCKWPLFKTSDYVKLPDLINGLSPMTLACYIDDPLFQLAKAYRYAKSLIGDVDTSNFPKATVRKKLNSGQKIRIGYLSSDLRDHAVGFALREVFELHDRSKFEIYTYYCGEPKTNDTTQARMKAHIDKWTDINGFDDHQAALAIFGDEIDILLDVNGFTKHARTKIFAYRPAPVAASFCGYPGTLASPYHQYLIADDFIVPSENEIFYSEKVLRITCNQPLDRKREISEKPTRARYNLPENAVVFACFNGMQKITQACFERWLTIMAAVPNSVLWLLEGENSVDTRLTTLALEKGIAPQRFIFAGKVQNPDHLARIAIADIFLDTFPYGAHSTGSDAISMGLPVLTFPGNGFASRFCASIINAAGVPELLCSSPEDYVAKAIHLANNPAELASIRAKILANKEASVLRDIPALVASFEDCLRQMQSDSENGTVPVPKLRNLDVYYNIGAEIIAKGFDYMTRDDYLNLYKEKLAAWDQNEPLAPDNRLWPISH